MSSLLDSLSSAGLLSACCVRWLGRTYQAAVTVQQWSATAAQVKPFCGDCLAPV